MIDVDDPHRTTTAVTTRWSSCSCSSCASSIVLVGALGVVLQQQPGARRAQPRGHAVRRRGAVRRAGRPLPGRRAGHRLRRRHRRAVPVRDHAARRRPDRRPRDRAARRPAARWRSSPASLLGGGLVAVLVASSITGARPAERRSPTGPPNVNQLGRARSSPTTCSPSRSRRCCSSSRSSAPSCSPGSATGRVDRRRTSRWRPERPTRSTPTERWPRDRSPRHRRADSVPGARRAAVHHRRGRPARAAQPARDVHVRRADAQRRQPHVRHASPASSTTSAVRSSCSSCWWWPPPRSWSASGSSWPSSAGGPTPPPTTSP